MSPSSVYGRFLVDGAARWARLAGDRVALLDGNPARGPVQATGEDRALAGLHTLVPVEPSKILGIGTNYRAHALEMGKPIPEEPLLFMKPPSALLAHGGAIVRPPGHQRVDFEGELGVVIGRRARHVPLSQALDHVFGLTCCNDVTVRDLQKKDVQFTRAKGFDSFCPAGPFVVTGLDPRARRLRTWVNGVTRQDSTTADMIFPVAELVAFLSSVMTLEAGDLIVTGTPQGVGNLDPGDEVAVEIEGIGTLANPVVAQ